jgi:hypothetical protein
MLGSRFPFYKNIANRISYLIVYSNRGVNLKFSFLLTSRILKRSNGWSKQSVYLNWNIAKLNRHKNNDSPAEFCCPTVIFGGLLSVFDEIHET